MLPNFRHDINFSKDGTNLNSKEHLTTKWLSESITELRNQIAELQESQANVTRSIQQRTPVAETISEMKEDIAAIRLEIKAIRERQSKTEDTLKELQDEAIQHVEDVKKYIIQNKNLVSFILN